MKALLEVFYSQIKTRLFGIDEGGNIIFWSAGMEALTHTHAAEELDRSWTENKFLEALPLAEFVNSKSGLKRDLNVKLQTPHFTGDYLLRVQKVDKILICELIDTNASSNPHMGEYLFRDNPMSMFIYDLENLKILDVNNSALDLYGWDKSEFLDLTIADIRPVEDIEKLEDVIKKRQTKFRHSGEWRHKTKSGKIFPVEIHSHLTTYNSTPACLVMANNIEKRKISEIGLAKSEALYKLIVETSQEGMWMIEEKEITTFVNPKMAEMLGYSVDEMIGKTLYDFMDEEGKMITKLNLDKRKRGIPEQHDFKFKRKDGSDLWCILNTNPIMDEDKYIGALAMITDISKRREMEVDLVVSETKFKSLIESSLDAILILDYSNGKINGCNLQAELLFGQNEDQLKDTLFTSLLAGQHNEFLEEFNLMLEEDGELFSEEYIIENKEGLLIPVDLSMNVIDASNNKIIQLVIRDITSRKHSELELKETNRKIGTLMENLPGAAYSAEAKYPFNMKFLSSGVSNLTGYDASELILASDLDYRELIVEEHKEKILSYIAEYVKAEEDFQISYKIKSANGTFRWILENGKSVWSEVEQKHLLEGYLTDVTNLKDVEEKLLNSQDFFKAILENSFDGVGVFDKNGIVKFQGPALLRILGYQPSELIERSIFDLIHEDDMPKAVSDLSNLLSNPGVAYNTVLRMRSKNGEYISIQSSLINLLNNTSIGGIIGNYRNVIDSASNIVESDTELNETPKLRGEFENLELDNMFQFLHLRDAESNSSEWMDAMVDFSRTLRKELKLTEIDPIRLISQVFDKDSISSKCELIINNEFPMKIRADKDQLALVFKELITNSINHNKDLPHLEIKARWMNKVGGPVLEYCDNGSFSENIDSKNIFQPFIVSDSARPGLGLTKVKKIVEKMDGKISAEISSDNKIKLFIALPFVDYIH